MEPFSNDPAWVKAEAALRVLPWVAALDFVVGRVLVFACVLVAIATVIFLNVAGMVLSLIFFAGAWMVMSTSYDVHLALKEDLMELRRTIKRAVIGSGLMAVPGLVGLAQTLIAYPGPDRLRAIAALVGLTVAPPLLLAALNAIVLLVYGSTLDELARLKQAREQRREGAAG